MGIAIISRPRVIPWHQIRSHGELPSVSVSSLGTDTDSRSSSVLVSFPAAIETHCHQSLRAVAPVSGAVHRARRRSTWTMWSLGLGARAAC
ncbi:hypothetical protein B0T18DRAFT_419598 [Schizothecium vesticola]|uniref:Uncharacterized protein n=1 Tax=Schizothecium vesticola TaxID=314040 RepID=A0AA40EKV8_9PEZI|nr:hypothetical protein B0T18DRAFT_419598 [Schizothecium vesticola]